MKLMFTVEVRDYESGGRDLTSGRIEAVIQKMLDRDSSDGVVIVQKTSTDDD